MARRPPRPEDRPKSLKRTRLEILLGGGLIAAAVPVAEKLLDDDVCPTAYDAVASIKTVEDVSPEFRAAYIRHMHRQLKIAEKCDREAEQ